MQTVTIAIAFLGGLAVFLFGMQQLTGALQRLAGERVRAAIGRVTGNRFTAALTGATVTAAVQSSSVTTVLCVGFVSAGIMSLSQSVGVILGANVGTTVNAQIVAFNVGQVALLLIAAGFALQLLGADRALGELGGGVLGIGMIFLGMTLMGDATLPLRGWRGFIDLMGSLDRPLLGLLAGAVFTGIIQSSAATIGIVIVLAGQGLVSLEAGIAVVLGANVGTCVTALLSALGRPRAALQVAIVHLLFNGLGAIVWLPLVDQLALLVRALSPVHAELVGTARLAAEAPRQIANAHTLFNLVTAAAFLPLTGALAAAARRLAPDRPEAVPPRAAPRYLDDLYLPIPAAAIVQLRLEVARLGDHATELFDRLAAVDFSAASRREFAAAAADLTRLYEAVILYARKLLLSRLGPGETAAIERLLSIANDYHAVADTIAINLDELIRTAVHRQIQASPETTRLLRELHASVSDSLRQSVVAVRDRDGLAATAVVAAKPGISGRADDLAAHLARRVTADGDQRLALYRLESDLTEYLKRIYYFAKRVAKAVLTDLQPAHGRSLVTGDEEQR